MKKNIIGTVLQNWCCCGGNQHYCVHSLTFGSISLELFVLEWEGPEVFSV